MIVGLNNSFGFDMSFGRKTANIIIKKQDCLSRVVMVTDEKQQILNCNILFYFKSIEQTITFELCFISQFKCNGLHDSFEIE